MKIGFATADWSRSVTDSLGNPAWGGSGWARLGQYHGRLPFETVAGVLVGKGNIFGLVDVNRSEHWDCDILVMQRYMFGDIADKLPKAKAEGQIIINDLDDWYWGLSTSNNAWLSTHPKTNLEENVNFYKSVIARSSAVHVSTPYLADRISEWVRCPIHVVPNFVDLNRFKLQRQHAGNQPIIGWCGSTSHRSSDLEILRGVLPEYQRRGFKFHHSGQQDGATTFADGVGVGQENVSTLPLVTHEQYPFVFQFDIGLVPLNDTPFNRAKSYIKGLEYSAAGVPWIASRVGEYTRLGFGKAVKNGAGWRKWIDYFVDPEHRRIEAKNNLEAVQDHDISHGIAMLTELLKSYAT
jgi:glycosyltransferase involved in cell wall biosynthesis